MVSIYFSLCKDLFARRIFVNVRIFPSQRKSLGVSKIEPKFFVFVYLYLLNFILNHLKLLRMLYNSPSFEQFYSTLTSPVQHSPILSHIYPILFNFFLLRNKFIQHCSVLSKNLSEFINLCSLLFCFVNFIQHFLDFNKIYPTFSTYIQPSSISNQFYSIFFSFEPNLFNILSFQIKFIRLYSHLSNSFLILTKIYPTLSLLFIPLLF